MAHAIGYSFSLLSALLEGCNINLAVHVDVCLRLWLRGLASRSKAAAAGAESRLPGTQRHQTKTRIKVEV
jgi:hypothetical protein